MQLNPKQHLILTYKNLPPKIKKYVKIQNQCIREKDQNGQLQKIFMAYAVFISSLAVQYKYPYIIMITASHNPPNYNGIKMQSLDPSEAVNVQEIQSIINDQNKLLLYLQRLQLQQSNKNIDFFVGRDTRPSSSRLSSILIDTLQKMGSRVVNLGQGSTPEIFSLSTYLSQKTTSNDPQLIQSLQSQYFEEVKLTLQRAVQLISSITGKNWQKKRIFIDFANGVGAVSFRKYQFLRQFFQFTITHHQNFAQPNVQCGAEWIYHHRLSLTTFSNLPQADFYVWFDGDSDRLIMKSGKQNQLIQGQDFNACLTVWLQSLISNLECSLSIGSVQSILTNYGSIRFLQNLNIQQKFGAVGICNLYKLAQTFDVSSFFQPNGHGCIYFSKHAIKTLEKLKKKYWQAELLLLIHNITKNNSRGYALHVFLVIMLYFYHNQTQNAFLFQKTYMIQKGYHLNKPQLFVNSLQGEKLLIQPLALVQDFAQVSKKYSDLLMKLRKSQTSPVLRYTIQGEQKTCRQCETVLQQIIKKYI